MIGRYGCCAEDVDCAQGNRSWNALTSLADGAGISASEMQVAAAQACGLTGNRLRGTGKPQGRSSGMQDDLVSVAAIAARTIPTTARSSAEP